VNVNTNIDRSKYARQLDKGGVNGGNGNWQHDPAHRQGVAYRDQATSKKFGTASTADAARARDSYRGRTETPQNKAAGDRADGGPGAAQYKGGDRAGGAGDRAQNKPAAPQNKGATNRAGSSNKSSAFDGANKGGSSTRAASSRGNASRSASPSPSARPRGGGGRRGR
jgi:hypothetical protein